MNCFHFKTHFYCLLLLGMPCINHAQSTDSILTTHRISKKQALPSPKITGRSYILPAALVTYGTVATIIRENKPAPAVVVPGTASKTISPLLEPENYTALAPAAAVVGLQAIGIKGVHKPTDQALLFTLSAGFSAAFVYPLKNNTGVVRPDKSDTHAFPSGHTALAFAAAEFLRREYGYRSAWYTIAGYAAATATAALRVAKDKHWLTDVSAGAGIGIASTTTVYWLYNRLKKRERPGKAKACIFAPAVSGNHYALQLIKPL
ncbi:phosphatase PAP2 family protein [Niabella pedocola]|uniref:Phosphatase PAP2 family protein n=1 Tax=Niabella pedocola TaxID=1752077 RepID=A0ABS8PMA2_9BACT|nr:phosphatase PAP2 family protein [Niabella pedocola]MCD2421373.1 phosphatase PAP2 family protein [Niabella pedocola]